MSGRLKDKDAIVTGAATGIGEEISKKFATEGASLRRDKNAGEVVREKAG